MHILALFLLAGFLHGMRTAIKRQRLAKWQRSCYKRVMEG
jgi:hypothetical protein